MALDIFFFHILLFSAPEPAFGSSDYCDHTSVVCASSVRRWLFTFSKSLKPLNGIQQHLTGSKIWVSSTKFVFFRRIREKRWPPQPLIRWYILTSPLKPLNWIQRNLTRSKISTSCNKFVFMGWSEKQDSCPGRSVKKAEHCTQVHDMWPFGPLFYAPGLKGPSGAASNRIVCLSVCLSVIPSRLQTKCKFGWWYSNQTWIVSSSIGSSHFTDISCPWGWGGVKI